MMRSRVVMLVVFTLLYSFKGFGQTYYAFPDSNAVWRVDWGTSTCLSFTLPDAQYQYVITGDTVIGPETYQKIERSGICTLCCMPPLTVAHPDNRYMGALRQDTLLRHVYYLPSDSTTEYLLYDFSLSLGDTVKGYLSDATFSGCIAIVDSIDSVLIDGSYRRRIMTSGCGAASIIIFIEGIGSTYGLLEPFFTNMEATGTLICFELEGQTIYPDTLTPCPLITSVYEGKNNKARFEVFPNPANKQLYVKAEDLGGDTIAIELYDALGRRKAMPIIKAGGYLIVNTEGLTNGLYLLFVYSNQRYISHCKIIIQQSD